MDYDVEHLRRNFSNVCRFCLAENDCLPLFIESVINEALLDAIDVLLLKVDENDGFPNMVCERCYRTMADFAKFEATALEAYRALKSVLMLKDEDNCTNEDKQHEKKTVSNGTAHDANAPLELKTTGKKKSCPVCGKLVSQLSKHMPVHGGTNPVACEHCHKRFAHPASLRKHLNIHRDIRNHRCGQCDRSFCDRSSLRYHLASQHQSGRRFQCESCDREFHSVSQWKQHALLAHGERNYPCIIWWITYKCTTKGGRSRVTFVGNRSNGYDI
uniref:ZAD domain-containing protein n=1 Tax=Anopheles farauti TaxID=69004 RepID=A0A182QW19_9DIPT